MTSTIRVDNFGPSAGGTTYSARGIAKAWVNFDGTGTIAARDSENVSSLTDNGTGDYTVNIANDFAAADYSSVFCVGNTTTTDGFFYLTSQIVGSVTGRMRTHSGSLEDAAIVCGSLDGDLA